MPIHNKLVRDKIPDIIKGSGKTLAMMKNVKSTVSVKQNWMNIIAELNSKWHVIP